MARTKTKTLAHCETPETTNTAIRIILKDLDVLFDWAEADEKANIEAGDGLAAARDRLRARTYQQCRHRLANAFKGAL